MEVVRNFVDTMLYAIFLAILFSFSVVSCETIDNCDIIDNILTRDITPVQRVLLSRAEQMTQIRWTPLRDIPNNRGYFERSSIVCGVPYSSVKELEKYVGQYVSFYTFMTAVNNPKSVLYTENVKELPYNGTNCSTYYGTVCSMTVNYVLGLPYSYTTSHYKYLECFHLVSPQSIDAAEPGDILLQDSKHVVMILDIEKNHDDIEHVTILESSAGRGTRVDNYSKSSLLFRWENDGWELLRYNDLNKIMVIDAMAFNDFPYTTSFNSPICCSRGDRACFREGEEIVLNNLDGKQHMMSMLYDNQDYELVVSDGSDLYINTLLPGIYTFDLSTKGWDNPSVEVLDTTVSAERKGDELTVFFSSSNGKAMSVIICSLRGDHYLVQPITEEERIDGQITVKIPNRSIQMYLKVMFEGTYGSVSNEPIAI